MSKIDILNISKKYSNKTILDQINISFEPGKIIGLTGNNGSGKTTFLKLICGLILPDKGDIYIEGMNLIKNRTNCIRKIGVFLEGHRSTYWRLSVRQNLIYLSGLKGIFGKHANERINNLLQLFDLKDISEKKVEAISFGMKQRLALACSVLHEPSILLFDEPTIGLDLHSQSIFEKFIQSESQKNKLIILTGHDIDFIKKSATIHLKYVKVK